MNKLNVVFLKLPTLYEILSEIKLELNFKLINFNEKNDRFKKFIEENPEVLIISPDLKDKLWTLHQIEIPVFEWNGLQLIRLSVQIYNQRNDIDSLMSALPSLI